MGADVELGEDASCRGDIEAVRAGRLTREYPEGAHPARSEQRAGGEGRVLRVEQQLVPRCELHVQPEASSSALRRSCRSCSSASTSSFTCPVRLAGPRLPGPALPAGSGAAEGASGRRGCRPRSRARAAAAVAVSATVQTGTRHLGPTS